MKLTAVAILSLLQAVPASLDRVTTPAGTLILPDGCQGANIPWSIDAFLGDFACRDEGLNVLVFGSVYGADDPCASDPLLAPRSVLLGRVSIVTQSGVKLSLCQGRYEGQAPSAAQTVTGVVIGPDTLTLRAETSTPEQVFLLLRIAATFTPASGVSAGDAGEER